MLHLLSMFSIDIRVIQYFIRVLLLFGLYTLLRVLFILFNWNQFEDIRVVEFIYGIRYDAVSIALWFLPFHVLSLIGIWLNHKIIAKSIQFFLLLGLLISIVLTSIDFQYYPFTLKRTTSDVLGFFTGGGDIWSLIPQFLIDFWYVFFVAALLVYGSFKLFSSTYSMNLENFEKGNWLSRSMFSVLILGLFVLMARGGVQLIPIKIIDAALHTSPQNVPIVLNTPFTFIKTLGKPVLPEKEYFSEDELNAIYSPIQQPFAPSGSFKKKNVVIIVLESFSNEFIRSERNDYLTPFFNELKAQALSFENCYANGKKSIEGIPSVFSGVPTWSDHPIITGTYGGNQLNSIATYLKKEGYNSSFFHGGRNGTMSFDSYIIASGFDQYIGLNEYPDAEEDFDGTWGIFDDRFYPFFNQKLEAYETPFLTGFFSLSSHHPYKIPKRLQSQFNKSKKPMENSIAYADYSLKQFFEVAKSAPWYDNTLFVITADHTPVSIDKEFSKNLGLYHIPLLFFCPSDSGLVGVDSTITQQIDIVPSILDYLNYGAAHFSFGSSKFDTTSRSFSVQYINGVYQMVTDNYILHFAADKTIGLYNRRLDKKTTTNLMNQLPEVVKLLERKMKAVLQQYNNRIIHNQLTE